MKQPEPKSKKNAGTCRRAEKDMPRFAESIREISAA
jgi:hypothetical protein